MDVVLIPLIVISSIWVYFDARAIGARRDLRTGFFNMGPLGWALACILLWIVCFPAYLIQRSNIQQAASGKKSQKVNTQEIQQTGLNKAAKYIAIVWTVLMGLGAISGLVSLGEVASDHIGSEFAAAGFAIGATLSIGMWFVGWMVVALPATIVFLITRKNVAAVVVEQTSVADMENTRKCPYCAESIKVEAVFCRFCQKELMPAVKKENPESKPTLKKRNWQEEGKAYYKNGEYKQAAAALSQAIKENPSGGLYYTRAATYQKIKERGKMIADLKAAANFGHAKAKEILGKIS